MAATVVNKIAALERKGIEYSIDAISGHYAKANKIAEAVSKELKIDIKKAADMIVVATILISDDQFRAMIESFVENYWHDLGESGREHMACEGVGMLVPIVIALALGQLEIVGGAAEGAASGEVSESLGVIGKAFKKLASVVLQIQDCTELSDVDLDVMHKVPLSEDEITGIIAVPKGDIPLANQFAGFLM